MLPQRPEKSIGARRDRAGFRRGVTLFELLLVIGLLLLVVYFAWPDYRIAAQRDRLDESATRFSSLIAMCRAESMNDGLQVQVVISADGRLHVVKQKDAVEAADQVEKIRDTWANIDILLDGVWVEAVQALPGGPAPIIIEDDQIEFSEVEMELTRVSDLEQSTVILIEPDGTSNSLRMVLRDRMGFAKMVVLDGRLGRVRIEDHEPVEAATLEQPLKLEDAEVFGDQLVNTNAPENGR